MPITQRNGDTVTVTISPDEEQKLKQLEQEAIKNNFVVAQHGGATMLEKGEIEQKKPVSTLTLYRLIKKIIGDRQAESSIIIPEVHSASTSSTNNTTNTTNTTNTNIVLRNLMKKIANSTSPFSP
jgi:hypothetical protein